jgi:thiamine-phosphate pyrophosphorylase
MSRSERLARLDRARLYFISDATPGGRPLADVLPAALRGGVDVFQLRCKGVPDDMVIAAAEVARTACDAAGALFIVNDRPDLVAHCLADGVHVGQDDEPLAAARAAAGEDALIGLSTHGPAQLAAAVDADYVGVGPVYATPTKDGREPVGLGYVRHAAGHARVPFFAIGGIDAGNAAAVLAAGARRLAVVRAIAHAADPQDAARRLRAIVDAAPMAMEATSGSA